MDYKRCEMDIRVLWYLLAVAREESFTGAADSLMASQPTLSKQIAQLERELGKKLFERGGRRVTLTEDGVLLYRRAGEIIALVGRTEREFKSDEHDVSGRWRSVGISPGSCSRPRLGPMRRTGVFASTGITGTPPTCRNGCSRDARLRGAASTGGRDAL
ncbi:LysR family transcriptional regulator [Bifidobacterium longum]|uniref:LysR family transcriptional regulator n=1 Tax=Bifidobacterium longum TaxID=216816 RepID=UPI0020748B60|nr:LysR family transcriptional regulator [Bifidobacterium longum]